MGCASQGPLRPPSLHLPARVQGLAAERFGDTVDLRWTTPEKTTDGAPLQTHRHSDGPLAAEICREAPSAGTAPATCMPMARVPVESGKPGAFHDRLPDDWAHGIARALVYRVRVVNGNGRGAMFTDVTVGGGEAPPPMTDLSAAAMASGVALRWRADGPGNRTMLRVSRSTAGSSSTAGSPRTAGSSKETLLAVEAGRLDPGGAVDQGAKPGVEQRYTVYRTRTVELRGQTLTINGAPATVTVAADAADAPPAAPVGLEAVANTLGAPEIDLVWQPSVDAGVAGYRVFRAEGEGEPQPLEGAELVRGFSFADTRTRPGGTYRYRVAAVDAQGHAGPQSAETRQTVPAQ